MASETPFHEPDPSRPEPPRAEPDVPVFEAELAPTSAPEPIPAPRPRRRLLPACLFLITCVSTFFVGSCLWVPGAYILQAAQREDLMPIRRAIVAHWADGLAYMSCVLLILFTHEMGHFLATLRHRIPASYPFFLPLPIGPLGTLGAVIAMDGKRANRRQLFDIGIAGPLAGLAVALPIFWIGVLQLDLAEPRYGAFKVELPLAGRWITGFLQPSEYIDGQLIWHGHLNPYLMAGWVGLFITGLNMMPVSQLDGGHIAYALLGKRAHWLARGLMLGAVAWGVYHWVTYERLVNYSLMIFLILFVFGTDHPPTRDDNVSLGWFRTALGVASLALPVLCLAPELLVSE